MNRGNTLIEVLIALALTAITSIFFIRSASNLIHTQMSTSDLITATLLSQSDLEITSYMSRDCWDNLESLTITKEKFFHTLTNSICEVKIGTELYSNKFTHWLTVHSVYRDSVGNITNDVTESKDPSIIMVKSHVEHISKLLKIPLELQTYVSKK